MSIFASLNVLFTGFGVLLRRFVHNRSKRVPLIDMQKPMPSNSESMSMSVRSVEFEVVFTIRCISHRWMMALLVVVVKSSLPCSCLNFLEKLPSSQESNPHYPPKCASPAVDKRDTLKMQQSKSKMSTLRRLSTLLS